MRFPLRGVAAIGGVVVALGAAAPSPLLVHAGAAAPGPDDLRIDELRVRVGQVTASDGGLAHSLNELLRFVQPGPAGPPPGDGPTDPAELFGDIPNAPNE